MMRRNEGTADSFVEGLCLYRGLVFVLFVISALMLLLSLISYAVVEPGTPTYVVVVMNLFGLGGFTLLSGAVLYVCRNGGN